MPDKTQDPKPFDPKAAHAFYQTLTPEERTKFYNSLTFQERSSMGTEGMVANLNANVANKTKTP